MKHSLLVSLALSAGLTAPVLAQAPATPAAPAAATTQTLAIRVSGTVTVDSTKTPASYTVTGRNGTTTTFTLTPDAKVTRMVPATQSDLTQGAWVSVNGPITGDTTTPSITANNVVLLAGDPGGGTGKKAGMHRNRIDGKVAKLTPLTLTTAGGVTVNVTLNTAPATRFTKATTAGASEITTGQNIQARVTGSTATEVTIQPARRGRRGGRRGAQPTAPGADQPAAPATPAAP